MSEGARIDNGPFEMTPGAVNSVDEFVFCVGLKKVQFNRLTSDLLPQRRLNII